MTLQATTPLDGYNKDFGSVVLSEVTGKALVSIAIPSGNEKKLSRVLQKEYQVKLPAVGSSSLSSDGGSVILGMQSDQLFMLFDYDGTDSVEHVENNLGNIGYYTDQSDSWAMLNISGPNARPALERICMLDLHPLAFPFGCVGRTVMEHLGAIIHLQSNDRFLILTARSSAKSLLHALKISIHNIS